MRFTTLRCQAGRHDDCPGHILRAAIRHHGGGYWYCICRCHGWMNAQQLLDAALAPSTS